MNSNTLIRTILAALVAAFVALPSSHAATIWSWAAGDAPWVAPTLNSPAVFNDNNGAVWKIQDAPAGLASPNSWANLTGNNFNNQYISTAASPNGSSTTQPAPIVGAALQSGTSGGDSLTSSVALVFEAPITGNYSISGKAWLGQWGGAGNATISVGKIQSNTFTQLALYGSAPWAGLGPDFSSFGALNSISLTAGDSLAFILPHSGYNGQRWWLYDPNGYTDSAINANALTVSVPEPSTWAMLAVGLTTVMVLRRRRA